MNQQAL